MQRQLDMFKVNSYHNSLPEFNQQVLDERESKAQKQEEKIAKLFQDHPRTNFNAYEVYLRCGQQWPKSSVQRAITNLTKNEKLVLVPDVKRKGEYDVETNCWQWKG